jgi:Glycerophosphoryl diester phosphodiesterase family
VRTAFLACLIVCATACGSSEDASGTHTASGGSGGTTNDASAGSGGNAGSSSGGTAGGGGTAGSVGGGGSAGVGGAAGAGGGSAGAGGTGGSSGTYKTSLKVCWSDPTCPRVLAVAHGGLWNYTSAPYDSDAALAAAYAGDVDGVKIDVRVTKDNVPVISHSSPITFYESLDCYNRKIEEMTAAEVTSCHRFPSTTETFQRLDDVLKYLEGKMVVELTVKLSSDYARTISEVHAQSAEDFAFLEISPSELQNLIPTIAGADSIYYLINVASNVSEVDTLIALNNPHAFMYEFDPTVDVSTLTPTKLHPAGVRSFTYTDAAAPSVGELQALYQGGFDAVSSNAAANGVTARIAVNQANGVSPP